MKKTISILLAAIAVSSLAACQTAPEETVVVKTDTERMVAQATEQSGGASVSSLGVPQGKYVFDATGADGKLHIRADANVHVPDAESLPIMEATVSSFTQDQVTAIFNCLFPNEKPMTNTQTETKSDIEAEIARMRKQLADGDVTDFTTEQFEAMIAQLEESCKSAPDSAPDAQVSDGTMQLIFDAQTNMPLAWTLSAATATAQFSVCTPADVAGIGSQASGAYVSGASIYYKRTDVDYSTRHTVSVDGTDSSGDADKKIGISYAEATELCENLFAAAGMANNFCVGAAYIVDDTGADELQGENYAYLLCYTRQASGVPLFYIDPLGTVQNQDDAFSLPWDYETAVFIVDASGIVSLRWRDPIDIGETIEPDCTLKTFEEITGVFEAMMKTSYEAVAQTVFDGKCEFNVSVTDVQLCLMRIRQQNAAQTDGLLVPAWVFYGQNEGTNESGEVRYFQGADVLTSKIGGMTASRFEIGSEDVNDPFVYLSRARESEPVVLLAINAVDGSIIDITKGY